MSRRTVRGGVTSRKPRPAPAVPHDVAACHCPACVAGFRRELRRGADPAAEQLRLPIHPLPHVAGEPEGSTSS